MTPRDKGIEKGNDAGPVKAAAGRGFLPHGRLTIHSSTSSQPLSR